PYKWLLTVKWRLGRRCQLVLHPRQSSDGERGVWVSDSSRQRLEAEDLVGSNSACKTPPTHVYRVVEPHHSLRQSRSVRLGIQRIDLKVSSSPYGYKLQEAQAILSEVRSIRDAISSGEKEKQELMQVRSTAGFKTSRRVLSDIHQGSKDKTKNRGSLRCCCSVPGADRHGEHMGSKHRASRLFHFTIVIAQKLAVLKDSFQLDSGSQQELWGSSPSLANSELSLPRLYSDAGSQTDIPAEHRHDLHTFTPSHLHTRHTFRCLSASTLSCSSGSSRGSLTSSRGSLATTSSLGSTSSLSFSDIYLEQPELADPDFQNKLDSLLEGGQGGYRPSSSITTIHEHEVVTAAEGRDAVRPTGKAGGVGGSTGGGAGESGGVGVESGSSRVPMLRPPETPRSMSSLSPRSSLSSLSPPCSPLVTDSSFLSGDTFAGQTGPGGLGLDLELHSRLAELELSLDCQEQRREEQRGPAGLGEKQNHNTTLGEEVKG
ncbi:hypothetical protein FQN60_000328, partial [Etheostoma spectabile]